MYSTNQEILTRKICNFFMVTVTFVILSHDNCNRLTRIYLWHLCFLVETSKVCCFWKLPIAKF